MNEALLILDREEPVLQEYPPAFSDLIEQLGESPDYIELERFVALVWDVEFMTMLRMAAKKPATLIELKGDVCEAHDRWYKACRDTRRRLIADLRFGQALVRLGHLPEDWDDI